MIEGKEEIASEGGMETRIGGEEGRKEGSKEGRRKAEATRKKKGER